MNTSLDGGIVVTPRREPLASGVAAAVTAANAQPAQTGPAAVPPATAAERSARLPVNEDEARQGEAQDHAAKAPARTSIYDRRLTYENEQARTFLDVINPETDELVMRFPPESLVEYLKQSGDGPEKAGTPVGAAVNTTI